MNKKLIVIIIIIAALGISFGVYKFYFANKNESETSKKEIYTCIMHPQIVRDHPGVCPICNMDLVLKGNSEDIKIDSSINLNKEIGDVVISPSQQVLANVQTEKVQIKEFRNDIVFNGYIKVNEKNVRHIATPVPGKILKMFVNYEGQIVSKGEAVLQIYSPEILSTQKEYLLALENYERVRNSGYSIVVEQAKNLVSSARTRLELWEVTPEQMEELESTHEVRNYITVYSKYNGVITKKIDNEGHWAAAGEDIYDIVDMSTVWVIANVPESDVSIIKLGQTAKITSISYPDEAFSAKINFLNPVFNSDSRTLEVRLDVSNKNYKLKPDMFVKVYINSAQYGWDIVVPRNAVLRTGKMDIVYVKKENNIFTPKMVTVGGERDGYYLISSGLKEGDEIVTSAGFLIDSESQIRSAGNNMQGMEGMDMKKDDEPKFNKDQDVMKDMNKK